MIIALDYDGTYTRDPALWDRFIVDCKLAKHEIICITMRYPKEEISLIIPVYYTSRKAKLVWAQANNIKVDIWIDDQPALLFNGAT